MTGNTFGWRVLVAALAWMTCFSAEPVGAQTDATPTPGANTLTREERVRIHEERVRAIIEQRRQERQAAGELPVPTPPTPKEVRPRFTPTSGTAGLVTAIFQEAPAKPVFDYIAASAGVSIALDEKLTATRITIVAKDLPLDELLDQVCEPQGWHWRQSSIVSYEVGNEEWYKETVLMPSIKKREIQADGLNVENLRALLAMLVTPGAGEFEVREVGGEPLIVVTDVPESLERIESLVRRLSELAANPRLGEVENQTPATPRPSPASSPTPLPSPTGQSLESEPDERRRLIKQHEARVRAIIEQRRAERLAEEAGTATQSDAPMLAAIGDRATTETLSARSEEHTHTASSQTDRTAIQTRIRQQDLLDGLVNPALEATSTTLVFGDAKAEQVLAVFSNQLGVRVTGVVPAGQLGRTTIRVENMAATEVLDQLAEGGGWVWGYSPDGMHLRIGPAGYYSARFLVPRRTVRTYFLGNQWDAEAARAFFVIERCLTPGLGHVLAVRPAQALVVCDLPAAHEDIESALGIEGE